MKKKLLWAAGVVLLLVVVLAVGLSILVRTYLKSERLKGIIIPRIEARTGAKAEIDTIQVSLFKGIVVKGISLRQGDRDFVSTEEFILDYSLLPLLRKQLVINRIEILSPSIHVRRYKDGTYNFAPLTEKKKTAPEKEEKEGLPVTLITEKIIVKDAHLEFLDELGELPGITAEADMALSLSLEETLKAEGRLDLKSLKAALKGLKTDTSGRIQFDTSSMDIDLKTALGKDTVRLTGSVKDYLQAPDITLDLSAASLDLDKLIPEGDGKGGGKSGKAKTEGKMPPIRAQGEVKVVTITYKGYEIKDFQMGYSYADGEGSIKPLSMNLAGGEKVSAKGELTGEFRFNYTPGSPEPAEAIKNTLRGEGDLTLGEGSIKPTPITSAVALFTGIEELREPGLGSADFHFTIKDRKVLLDGMMQSSLYKANPSGTVGMDRTLDLAMDLKLSPQLAGKLPEKIRAYTTDEEGWASIPLRIRGTAGKPSVGLDTKAAGEKIKEGVKKKLKEKAVEELEKRLKPSEGPSDGPSDEQKKSSPEDLIRGIFGK